MDAFFSLFTDAREAERAATDMEGHRAGHAGCELRVHRSTLSRQELAGSEIDRRRRRLKIGGVAVATGTLLSLALGPLGFPIAIRLVAFLLGGAAGTAWGFWGVTTAPQPHPVLARLAGELRPGMVLMTVEPRSRECHDFARQAVLRHGARVLDVPAAAQVHTTTSPAHA